MIFEALLYSRFHNSLYYVYERYTKDILIPRFRKTHIISHISHNWIPLPKKFCMNLFLSFREWKIFFPFLILYASYEVYLQTLYVFVCFAKQA